MIASNGKAMFSALEDNHLLLPLFLPRRKSFLDLSRALDPEGEILIADNDAQRQLYGVDLIREPHVGRMRGEGGVEQGFSAPWSNAVVLVLVCVFFYVFVCVLGEQCVVIVIRAQLYHVSATPAESRCANGKGGRGAHVAEEGNDARTGHGWSVEEDEGDESREGF